MGGNMKTFSEWMQDYNEAMVVGKLPKGEGVQGGNSDFVVAGAPGVKHSKKKSAKKSKKH